MDTPRPILTEKRYRRMKRMIKGTDEDVRLITNIVNECDIDKSLLYILALIPQRHMEASTFCTPLSQGERLFEFLKKRAMTVHYNLDTLVGVWQIHCEVNGIDQLEGHKFLAKEYVSPPSRSMFKGHIKPTLNPKKKRV
jgi:hypothetical protein